MSTLSAGAASEARAAGELQRAGLSLIARNWRCRGGEIDLVMRDGDTLVFVEVRYRAGAAHGSGLDSVGAQKRARLITAAEMFLVAHPQLAALPCRFDVVAYAGEAATGDWQRAAFDAF